MQFFFSCGTAGSRKVTPPCSAIPLHTGSTSSCGTRSPAATAMISCPLSATAFGKIMTCSARSNKGTQYQLAAITGETVPSGIVVNSESLCRESSNFRITQPIIVANSESPLTPHDPGIPPSCRSWSRGRSIRWPTPPSCHERLVRRRNRRPDPRRPAQLLQGREVVALRAADRRAVVRRQQPGQSPPHLRPHDQATAAYPAHHPRADARDGSMAPANEKPQPFRDRPVLS